MSEQVDPVLHAARKLAVDDVDADMLVLAERIGSREHEGGTEKIPLRLQPGIRRHVEYFSDDSIAGTDQHGHQDQPRD